MRLSRNFRKYECRYTDGQVAVQIRDGMATWTSPDEGEGGGKEDAKESE